MNKVILLGRLTKDIELKRTQTDLAYTNFTLAVNRQFKDKNGNKKADFISCIAWKQTAEIISKYFQKGSLIAISGSITTSNYTNNEGKKVFTTSVYVEEVTFVESKKNREESETSPNDFMPNEEAELSDDLPF